MGAVAERFTNNKAIGLAVAVWLAHDDYDYSDDPNTISVTKLIRPLKQLILSQRVPPAESIPDIADVIQARFGQTLHSGVENAWKNHYKTSLLKLGYPPGLIRRVRINPEQQEPDTLPVYTEVRLKRQIMGFTISGKVDLVIEGRLHDVKKTSVFGYQSKKSTGTTWKLQGSIYRWLDPEKIVHDDLVVQYLLLDWSRAMGARDPNYPPHPVPSRSVPLMSVAETEHWITNKLTLLLQLKDAPEELIPPCSDEDLWRSDPVFKYYAKENPVPGSRSTKNFDDLSEAMNYKAAQGKGTVLRVPGKVRACGYCPALPICNQARDLVACGDLVI